MDNQGRRPDRIRIGVAGVGKMGLNHIRALSAMTNLFELVGIYDPIARKSSVADEFGVRFFSDYTEMLGEVQAVTLPCPTSLHKEMAMTAAAKGVHVLVEKPVAETAAQAVEMQEAFSKKGLTFAVGHIERFNPAVKKMAEIVKDERIIGITSQRCSPYDGRIVDVDVVTDLMIHDLDIIINSLVGEKPREITSLGLAVHSEHLVDYAQSQISFPGGAMASVIASRCTQDRVRRMIVHTDNSLIECDMLRRALRVKKATARGIQTEDIIIQTADPLREELRDFASAILDRRKPTVCGDDVVRTMEALDSIETCLYQRGGDAG